MDGRGIRSLRNRSNGRGLFGGVTYDGINQMKEKTHGSKAKPTRGFKLRKTTKTFLVLGGLLIYNARVIDIVWFIVLVRR